MAVSVNDSSINSSSNVTDEGEDDIGWEESYYGRDGVIFLVDCNNQNPNALEHLKESFLMIEKILMNGIKASGKTMVSR